MSVDCGACFAKYLLCFFNFFFFIAGTVVLGVGIWLAADKESFIQVTKIIQSTSGAADELSQFTQPSVVEQAAYFLIAAGAFVFFISFLGYCGALRESRCLLTCYGVALILVLLLEVAAIALAVGYRERAEEETRKFLKSTIQNYYAGPGREDGVTVFWNHMMFQLHCCGVDGYDDFKMSQKWSEGNLTIPSACCVMEGEGNTTHNFILKDPNCPHNPTDSNSYRNTGCYDMFVSLILEHASVVISVSIALGVVQILGVFLAFCLVKSIDQYLK